MFIPCDHCLRKHATRRAQTREDGKRVALKLCNDCYERFKAYRGFSQLASDPTPAVHPLFKKSIHTPQSEEEFAAKAIASLQPRDTPSLPGYDLSAFYRPAQQVGGDHYAFIRIDPDRIGFLIADVAGRGIPAAISMIETSALMRFEGRRSKSPADLFFKVNRLLHKDLKRETFVTAFYAQLSIGSGRLDFVSAGHNPLVLWRQATGRCEAVNPNGLALAIDPGPVFERTLKEETLMLEGGDRFTLHTDGIVDALNEGQERYGLSRLERRLKELAELSSGELLEKLMESIQGHRGKAPQSDDYAALTVRRLPK